MLAKFDTTSCFNPDSLVTDTRRDKLSFLAKKIIRKFIKNTNPSSKKSPTPFELTPLKSKFCNPFFLLILKNH